MLCASAVMKTDFPAPSVPAIEIFFMAVRL
jgi:hypothetical protein